MIVKNRIQSIDVVRGIAMIIMALDHVRTFFLNTSFINDPLDLNTTTPPLFFTRWITHFCAPAFVFLAGTSIYLVSLRKTRKELKAFLIKRGIWLIVAGIVLVNLGWTFDPFYKLISLEVLWTIGISMILMSLLVQLPFKWLLATGLLIVCCHNLLDYPEAAANGHVGLLWTVLHYGRNASYPLSPNHNILIAYPFLAWTGVLIIGYCFGKLYAPGINAITRQRLIISLGAGLIVLFIILRLINHYGDPYPWRMRQNLLFTFLSFLKVYKYPPSLMYLCIMLGPLFILLALAEKIQNKITAFFNIFGKVPMFFFIIQFFFIHFICVLCFFIYGHTLKEAYQPGQEIAFRPVHFGYSLPVVYIIWMVVIAALYPLCKKYGHYKSTHNKWWLSYW